MAGPTRDTRHLLATLLAAALLWGVGCANAAEGEPRAAVVIELDGAIGPGTAGYVLRNLQERDGGTLRWWSCRLDTPGGLDSAMRDIIRALLASPVPVLVYVAPSGARAASAGTYILYAAALAAMAPGTKPRPRAGLAIRVDAPAGTGPRAGRRGQPTSPPRARLAMRCSPKLQTKSSLRPIFAHLAVLHGRNADWAEKAVREAVSLSYDAALEQHVIDLVALRSSRSAGQGRRAIRDRARQAYAAGEARPSPPRP